MTEARALILGAGSWGTAVAQLLAESGKKVTLWSFSGSNYQSLNKDRKHPKLQELTLHQDVYVTKDWQDALRNIEIVFIAASSGRVRSLCRILNEALDKTIPVVILSKGLEFPSGKTLTEVAHEELGECSVSVLSGGSHAEEVIEGLPFGLTLAGGSPQAKRTIEALFSRTPAHISHAKSALQVEWFAALKNLLSIGVGISDTLGLGDNFRACFITDILKEADAIFHVKLGSDYEGLCSYGCLGDLFATMFSPHSRNRRYGMLLGKGLKGPEALEQVGMVVEGLNVARVAAQRLHADMTPMSLALAQFIVNDDVDRSRTRFLACLGYAC